MGRSAAETRLMTTLRHRRTLLGPVGRSRGLRTATTLGAAAALLATVGLTVVDPTAASAQTTSVRAVAAEDFIQSIGVATHFTYGDTAYGNYPLLAQRLRESGIKHVRDGWGTGSAHASSFVRDTLGPMGVKITMVFDPLNNATALQHKEMVKSQLLPVIAGVESLNEWDVRGGAGWADYARNWTITMSNTYRSDPVTAGIPLIGPSMAHTLNDANHAAMGDLSPYVDYGNTHDYPGDRFQMTDGIIDIVERNVGRMVPGKRIQATETGFTNGNVNALYPAMPERQVGVVLPRLYFDHFRRGIARSFSYELIDQRPNDEFESRFGLLRNDGTPKPSFHAVASMTRLLSDPGPAFTPGSLSYSLTGGDADTRQLLLQKRDGTYWLAVWQQTPVWNGSAVLDPPNRAVSLQLAAPHDASVHGLGTTADTPRASFPAATTVPVTSSEDVTLVRLSKAAVTSPTSPAPTASPVATPSPAPTASPVVTTSPAPTASPVVTTSPAPTASPAVATSPAPTTSPTRVKARLCGRSGKCWDPSVTTASTSVDVASTTDLAGDWLCLVVGDAAQPQSSTCTRGRSLVGPDDERAFLDSVSQLAGAEAREVAAAWFSASD